MPPPGPSFSIFVFRGTLRSWYFGSLMSGTVLFVCNFPFTTTEEDLRAVFAPYGDLQRIRLIHDRDNGRSRGYAFVELEDEEHAALATATLNESRFGGRRLAVARARGRGGLNGIDTPDGNGNGTPVAINGNGNGRPGPTRSHGSDDSRGKRVRERVEVWWSDDDSAWIGSVPALGLRILRAEPEAALRAVLDLVGRNMGPPLIDRAAES